MSFDASGEYVATACDTCGESLVTCPHVPAGTLALLKRRAAEALQADPEPVECPECLGSGQVAVGWGRGKRTETCPKCDGQGAIEEEDL